MHRYILKRLLSAIPVLLLVSIAAFVLIQLVPGDAAAIIAGADASNDEVEFVRQQLGLDRPWPLRLQDWLVGLTHGDLGYSYILNRPVTEAIIERLPVTLSLAGLSIIFATVMGVALGVLAAVFHRSWIDAIAMTVALFGVSVPNFWFGLVAILIFAVGLGWFPPGGYVSPTESFTGWLQAMALPALTLGTASMGQISRFSRSVMLEQLGQDYVRTARAKGLSQNNVIGRHALKNAMIPILTVIGISFSLTMAGAIIVESVFSLNGLGRLMLHGIQRRDYPVLQGGMLFVAFSFVLINLLVDILYSWLDPRVRYD